MTLMSFYDFLSEFDLYFSSFIMCYEFRILEIVGEKKYFTQLNWKNLKTEMAMYFNLY